MKEIQTSSRYFSILKNIVVQGNTHRIWQIVNKSPLINLVAWAKQLGNQKLMNFRASQFSKVKLTDDEQSLVSELVRKGFVEISQIIRGPELDAAVMHFENLIGKEADLAKAQTVNTKSFWIRLTDEEQKNGLNTENPFVKLALHEKTLKVIAGYIQQVPFLHSVLLTHSRPSEGDFKNSQLWHQDNDNHRMAKMFVYFSDVNADEDGPFTFLPADFSEKVQNSFFKRHLKDSQLVESIELKEIKKVKGKKLTAFICDTHRCYHMGSRVSPGCERFMLTSLYISLPSPYPKGDQRNLKITGPLSELQRAAVVVEES